MLEKYQIENCVLNIFYSALAIDDQKILDLIVENQIFKNALNDDKELINACLSAIRSDNEKIFSLLIQKMKYFSKEFMNDAMFFAGRLTLAQSDLADGYGKNPCSEENLNKDRDPSLRDYFDRPKIMAAFVYLVKNKVMHVEHLMKPLRWNFLAAKVLARYGYKDEIKFLLTQPCFIRGKEKFADWFDYFLGEEWRSWPTWQERD